MAVTVKLNYLRIAPRKVRLVADLVRRKKVEEAQAILNFTNKKAAPSLIKLLKSALASARNNFQLEPVNLYISKITVDEGPKYKRWMPRARGAVSEIQKKTSHITLVLKEVSPTKKKAKKRKEVKPRTTFQENNLGEQDAQKVVQGKREEKKEAKRPPKEKLHPPKFPKEILAGKPKIQRGIRRIFQRKAF